MLSDDGDSAGINTIYFVLILVLMEYALWPWREVRILREELVLILVLMEYALWL